jgi:hypothetical protein
MWRAASETRVLGRGLREGVCGLLRPRLVAPSASARQQRNRGYYAAVGARLRRSAPSARRPWLRHFYGEEPLPLPEGRRAAPHLILID